MCKNAVSARPILDEHAAGVPWGYGVRMYTVRMPGKMGGIRIFLPGLLLSAALAAQSGLSPSIALDGVVGSADFSSGTRIGIPRGSLFTIFGWNLAPGEARADQLPLPTVLNHVRVKVWASAAASGAFAEAPLLYVSPRQINAVLPSAVSEGEKAVTVQVDGIESYGSQFKVIRARFAAFTQAGLGFGPATLQQYDRSGQVSLNRFLNPARPGQTMVLWGTGLPAADDASDKVVLHVGGVVVTPVYAGPAPGQPGLAQINFVLPPGLPERCLLPFLVKTGQLDGGVLTLTHAATAAVCESEFGLAQAAMEWLDRGGFVRAGVLNIVSDTGQEVRQTIEAWLADYDAARLSVLATTDLRPGAEGDGGCASRSYSYTRYQRPPISPSASLYGIPMVAAGLAVRLTGAAGCTWLLTPSLDGIYRAPTIPPCLVSAYSFRGGAGQARPFDVTGVLPEPRSRSAITQFAVQESGGQLKANWQIPSWTAADQVYLRAASSFTLHGSIFSGLTTVNELVCRAAPAEGSFLFPPIAKWVLGLPDGGAVSMNLAAVSHRVIPAGESNPAEKFVDFVLVRILNGVTAGARPN